MSELNLKKPKGISGLKKKKKKNDYSKQSELYIKESEVKHGCYV